MADERCCGCVSSDADQDYDVSLHVGAIFIIFAVSLIGSFVPVIAQKIPRCSTDSIVMEGISAFAFGVVLATGLIHMVNEGIEKLSDECLGSIVEEYGCLGLAIVLATMVLMHFIECESVVFFGSEGSTLHGHGHDHVDAHAKSTISTGSNSSSSSDHPYQRGDVDKLAHTGIRRKIATIIFEAGVIFHSLIVGLDLGVTSGSEFPTLLIAICFHQFFEGIAVGNATSGSSDSRMKLMLLNLAFAITTPIGQAFGIAIHSTYSSSSTTALWVQGVFDCVAGGILLYTGLVELLTYNMTTNQKFLSRSTSQRFTLYICLWLGAGLMTLIGKWA
ncbi:Zinc (Zn2)-Iron (Fe2) Permease [Phytophthora megakarya]|uniref:Zinc (Zn2)-Iron (Fe2) Permease n=1 Tax=Phytophthora megakarya TaxID=4795 RepID=A0A225UPX4_9STRA|nr:Zinc (Zn2)-Iron (Fe2) Permease [Phytophthora megakarya]